MDNECTTLFDEFCIMTETLKISLLSTIDIQMVGVGRGDNSHPRTKPMERTVELIGLNHYKVAVVREDVVGAIVLGNAPKESITV